MKLLLKIILAIFLINVVSGMGFIAWLFGSAIIPAFHGTGITVSDFFKPHLDPAKYQKLEQNITARSSQLGKGVADGFLQGLVNSLSIKASFSQSVTINKNTSAATVPSVGAVMNLEQKKAQEGIDEGLNILTQSQKK